MRPADLLQPEWERLSIEACGLEGCDGTDEDVLTYAMFPGVATTFFAERDQGPRNVGVDPAEQATAELAGAEHGKAPVTGPIDYSVTVNGHAHHVTVERA